MVIFLRRLYYPIVPSSSTAQVVIVMGTGIVCNVQYEVGIIAYRFNTV